MIIASIHKKKKTLEFKRDLSSPANIMKTLVAFANTAGGAMLIGVEDDRTVIGIQGNPLDGEERLSNMITDAITPRLIHNIELRDAPKTGGYFAR